MKRKKVIVLLIGLTLLVSMTLPARVVVSADQAADSGEMPLLSEDEGKDISPEGAGDPDSAGADQGGAPSGPSGADQSGDSSGPSGVDQGGASSGPSGADQGGDSSGSSGADQSGDPSQPEGTGSTGEQNGCTCGHEDGTHAENCPLYEAPEGLEEEEEQAESNGASLIVSVQVSGADNGNAVLNLTGPGGYCKRIVVQGSSTVTLSGLEAGEYTVSDGTDLKSVTLEAGERGSLGITVTRSNHGWLTGEAYRKFNFDN